MRCKPGWSTAIFFLLCDWFLRHCAFRRAGVEHDEHALAVIFSRNYAEMNVSRNVQFAAKVLVSGDHGRLFNQDGAMPSHQRIP